jgi:dihydroxy-acid dehydratase
MTSQTPLPRSTSDGHGVDRGLTNYGDAEFSRYIRKAFLASAGYDADDLDRPIVGIADTSSHYATCHRQLPEIVRAVARGVEQAGGLAFVFPTVSLGEILTSPTTMLYRNLAAMATEELIRAQPMDSVVLMGGCDKTVPAHLMAAASADVPAAVVVAGPMLAGSWRGERIGACTDCREFWARHRAGDLTANEVSEVRDQLCFTAGTCMVMGTASTMACVSEALGLMLPGGATPPSPSGERLRHAAATGRVAVGLSRRPSDILTRAAFMNALVVLVALGGSTNAVIHLMAIAGRTGVSLSLDDVSEVSSRVPVLVDCKPAGSHYMEDFHRAGGIPALLRELEPHLELDCVGICGITLRDLIANADKPAPWQNVIRPLHDPLLSTAAFSVLRGSLAPDGALLKTAAASAELLKHRGPAVVLESPLDTARLLDGDRADVTEAHILILRNAGPVAAGMPEAGSLPIPRHLAARGVRDMVRITDGRMSGTAYGTVILHCSPEAATGGPLALVQDGDLIDLDVNAGKLDLLVDAAELDRRRAAFSPPTPPARGWQRLYANHVLPAHVGADLDFLSWDPT